MLPVMKVVVLLVCGFFLVTDCDSLPLKNDDGIPLSNRRCFNQCVNNTVRINWFFIIYGLELF